MKISNSIYTPKEKEKDFDVVPLCESFLIRFLINSVLSHYMVAGGWIRTTVLHLMRVAR